MEKEYYYWRNPSDENKPFVPIELPCRIGPKCGNFTIQGACSISSWSVVQNSANSIKYLSLLSGLAIGETPPNQMFCRKWYLSKNHSDLFCLTHPRFGTAVPCVVKLPFSISAAHNLSADLYIFCECKEDRCASGTSSRITAATHKTSLISGMAVAFHHRAQEDRTWCGQLYAIQYAFLTLRAASILSIESILYLSAAGPCPCGPVKLRI